MAPLSAALAHLLLDINRDFERHGAQAGEPPSLVLWADLLRVVPDEGISVTDLAPAARISRRAVRAWLGLEKRGWLDVEAPQPRVKVVKLTAVGRQARDRWGDLVVSTEQEWCAKVGGTTAKSLRGALERFVSGLDLELPHYPMTYGSADPSAVGGATVAARPGPPRIPPHGTDWVPVVRAAGDTVSALPLPALLSQALIAFTIDFEERARFPMALAAGLARAMPGGALPLRDVPPFLGVNGAGKSLLERHGIVRVNGEGAHRIATLTPSGIRIRESYEATMLGVARAWRERYGDDIVDDLSASLAAVDDQLAGDLPDHVLVRYLSGRGFFDVSLSSVA
jgi:hypothetical protein